MTDEFDRKWLELVTRLPWIEAIYALIGLTRLGERPTTVERLAAALQRPNEEAVRLAWEASRVRPDEQGRIQLEAPFGGSGGPSRRKLYLGDREIPVSGCAPDLLPAAAVLDVPFRVEDTCTATGAPIRIQATPTGVERVDPAGAVVSIVTPAVDLAQVRQAVCAAQNFYRDADADAAWQAAHPQALLLSVAKGFALFRRAALRVWPELQAA